MQIQVLNNQRKLTVSALEKLCDLYNCSEEYILEGTSDYSKPVFAFRTEEKNLDLNTIARMNKIIKNIELLADLTNEDD